VALFSRYRAAGSAIAALRSRPRRRSAMQRVRRPDDPQRKLLQVRKLRRHQRLQLNAHGRVCPLYA